MNFSVGRLKRSIRAAAAWTFHASSIYRWRHRGKVFVLMYHRVLTKSEVARYPVQPGMYVLDSVFAEQMSFVRRNFTVLSLQELLDLWQRGEWSAHARYCVITFDDGWLDNYRHAYPVLKQLRIPATIFLPTDYVGRNEWFWPDQLAVLCKVIADRKQRQEPLAAVEGVLSGFLSEDASRLIRALADQERLGDEIIERCKHFPIERIRELVQALAAELE
ncbi:MAG: polysaccharide deacetylase family protein [Nitrospira sp.]|nr:polysaccharide deacetylase family protein [Nitrospira sp.]